MRSVLIAVVALALAGCSLFPTAQDLRTNPPVRVSFDTPFKKGWEHAVLLSRSCWEAHRLHASADRFDDKGTISVRLDGDFNSLFMLTLDVLETPEGTDVLIWGDARRTREAAEALRQWIPNGRGSC